MNEVTSESTGKRYGVQRVCRAWERARSSLYERRQRAEKRQPGATPARRGPRPKHSDEALLAAIQADLERSPFQGEGHRKVHARLRILDGIRVSRKRVLRVMRENTLLSPHRLRQGRAKKHDGQIITHAPNVMWGTDGARVFTVDGSQYLSDHFQNQIRYWGIRVSFGFVEEPETNGVAERFNRTLKEQAIHGRIFRNVEEVRAAVRKFVDDYNGFWRPEKLAFKTPLEARQDHMLCQAA